MSPQQGFSISRICWSIFKRTGWPSAFSALARSFGHEISGIAELESIISYSLSVFADKVNECHATYKAVKPILKCFRQLNPHSPECQTPDRGRLDQGL